MDILTADDYEAVRGLLGVTELDVNDETIELPQYGPYAENRVQARLTDWQTILPTVPSGMLMRMATAYMTAALIAETYVQGGTVGLVHQGQNNGRSRADWMALAQTLWGRANEGIANLVEGVTEQAIYDLGTGMAINGPTRSYYSQFGIRHDWWKYPPVWRATGTLAPDA